MKRKLLILFIAVIGIICIPVIIIIINSNHSLVEYISPEIMTVQGEDVDETTYTFTENAPYTDYEEENEASFIPNEKK